MERDAALTLLRDTHTFPGPFEFRVVVRPPAAPVIVAAMVAAAGAGSAESIGERKSKNGTYLALHVKVHVDDAERVLAVWEVLRELEGVVVTL